MEHFHNQLPLMLAWVTLIPWSDLNSKDAPRISNCEGCGVIYTLASSKDKTIDYEAALIQKHLY